MIFERVATYCIFQLNKSVIIIWISFADQLALLTPYVAATFMMIATLSLFADDSPTNEYPFHVEFKDEKAVDCGVARDMLSGFWEEAARRKKLPGGYLMDTTY